MQLVSAEPAGLDNNHTHRSPGHIYLLLLHDMTWHTSMRHERAGRALTHWMDPYVHGDKPMHARTAHTQMPHDAIH